MSWAILLALASFAAGWAAASWRARLLEKMRARYLSFVSHEFITPVTTLNMTILNFLNGIFGEVREDQRPWLLMIFEQVGRLDALVGDLRDLIHIELHRDLHLNRERARLADLLQKSLGSMREGIVRSGAEVKVEGFDALPELDLDPERIQRVLTAALHHARKFRMKGPITLAARAAQGSVSVAVEYDGPVVAPELLRQALDLYFAVHNPKSQVLACTGLGLGLACRLVEAHGGRMTLEVDGAGHARIAFDLPAPA
ncbi:MAG: HAMP domain-containing histidine kinase [Elusimicrobia bacterium]|nr:HAMP domain-containing histidine kinase [Elusimicrobiota bacterium]